MSYLSRKDIDELKPSIDKAVYKVVGSSDTALVSTAVHCLNSGYDKRKTTDKLSSYVDSKKASKLAEKIFDLVENIRAYRSKKRSHDDSRDRDSRRSKASRHETERDTKSEIDKSKLSSSKIKEMMENAQKEIEERKKSLDSLPSKNHVNIANLPIPTPSIYGIPMGLLNRGEADKARKIAQLQAQIKSKLSSGILANVIQIPVVPDKPTPLILDEEGRTVDKSGKAVQLTHIAPTLKANIRAQKREQFKSQLGGDKVSEESGETKFFDTRIGVKPAMRSKRALRFHEPGKFQQLAERLRMKVSVTFLFSFFNCLSSISTLKLCL